jgi:release factor glutamine methyltransferase
MIHEHAARARERFARAGIPAIEAALDARLLAQFVLGWDSATFFTVTREADPGTFGSRYDELVCRREKREPLAYITGSREFWGLSFEVSPAVLIPRPETESLIEAAIEQLPNRNAPLRVADVCTGSGCVAVALAREYPSAHIAATDVSSEALLVARRNAARHGVADRVAFIDTDLLLGVEDTFDLIVSNPPYVAEPDRETLQPEVRDYEPALALFAGARGLAILERLVVEGAARLADGGLLLFEFGYGQAAAVEALIANTPGLTMVGLKPDLQGIPRVGMARKS